MLKNTWYEKAIGIIRGDKDLEDAVDFVTNEAPIMANMPMEAASHGFNDVYEVLTEVDGIEQTDLDAPVPEIELSSELEQISLQSFSGRIKAGIDKLKQLGKNIADYIADRLPKHFRKTMMNMEKTWIYNYARAYAIANYAEDTTRVIDGGGSNNTNYSLIAVRWEPGEITGLYDEEGFGDGKIFDLILESDGKFVMDTDGRTVASGVVKNYLGFKFANPRYVTAMVNIDKDTVPTVANIGDLIDDADGATAIYGHPTILRRISEAHGLSKVEYRFGDSDMGQLFTDFEGVPMIGSRQFERGTEANVVLPTP